MKIDMKKELEKKNINTSEKSKTGAGIAISTFLASNKNAVSEVKINFNDIIVSPYNTYGYTEAEINDLVASISSVGLLERLIVEKGKSGKYEILSGQKRFLAMTRIHDTIPDIFKKWFPDDTITCTLINLDTAYCIGESGSNQMSVDAKRRFIISSANIQHEKTVRDYMIQYKSKKDFYMEQKSLGLIEKGMKQRDFLAESLQIAARSTQKIITAEKTISNELWKALETFEQLNSFSQLDTITQLSEEQQNYLLSLIDNKTEFQLDVFLKNPVIDNEDDKKNEDISIEIKSEAKALTTKDIEKLIGLDQIKKLISGFDGSIEVKGKDIDKLLKVKDKILGQKENLEKALKKYKK